MTIPELIHLLAEASKLEEQGQIDAAYALCTQIVNDVDCPRQVKMTAEKMMDRMNNAPLPDTIKESKPATKDNVVNVDVFALEGIPQIEGKMPIRPEDYERIKAGIKKRGIINPLIVLPDFRLVCGYNRWKIAKELELKTVPVIFKDIPADKIIEYAMKDNIERRQLSTDQIAEYVLDVSSQGTGRPKKNSRDKTNEDIAQVLGVSERTVQRARKFAKKVQENPQLKGQSIRSVIEGNDPVDKFNTKFEYIIGVGDPTEEMINDSGEIIGKIFNELDPQNGDKIKIVTQVYLRRRK
jgi:ParB/RepB/Spo0J family partition protein